MCSLLAAESDGEGEMVVVREAGGGEGGDDTTEEEDEGTECSP